MTDNAQVSTPSKEDAQTEVFKERFEHKLKEIADRAAEVFVQSGSSRKTTEEEPFVFNWVKPIEEFIGAYIPEEAATSSPVPTNDISNQIRDILQVGMIIQGRVITHNQSGIMIDIEDILYTSNMEFYQQNFVPLHKREANIENLAQMGPRSTVGRLNRSWSYGDTKKETPPPDLRFFLSENRASLLEHLKSLFHYARSNRVPVLGNCSNRDLDRISVDSLEKGVLVSAVISSIPTRTDKIQLSFRNEYLPEQCSLTLGPRTREEDCFETNISTEDQPGLIPPRPYKDNYSHIIRNDRYFSNPFVLDRMQHSFHIVANGSMFDDPAVKPAEIPPYSRLRSEQSNIWVTQAVHKGIGFAKEDKNEEAIRYYDEALKLDPKNMDAMVARGAALANLSHFESAIAQLEHAIKVDPKHENANKYLEMIKAKLKPPELPKKPRKSNTDTILAALKAAEDKKSKKRKHKNGKKRKRSSRDYSGKDDRDDWRDSKKPKPN